MSDEIKNVLPFVQFNANAVASHFSYISLSDLEKRAMAFLYERMDSDNSLSPLSKLEHEKVISEMAFEAIQTPLELYKHHIKFFPLSGNAQWADALSLAVICGQYVHQANDFLPSPTHQNDNDDIPMYRDDGFDNEIVGLASYIVDTADDILEEGGDPELQDFEPEVLFYAHLKGLLKLMNIEAEFSLHTNDQLVVLLQKDFPAIENLIHPQYSIGSELQNFLNFLNERVVSTLPSELFKTCDDNKPDLRLIVTNNEPQGPSL
jgi:hypothetical protein